MTLLSATITTTPSSDVFCPLLSDDADDEDVSETSAGDDARSIVDVEVAKCNMAEE